MVRGGVVVRKGVVVRGGVVMRKGVVVRGGMVVRGGSGGTGEKKQRSSREMGLVEEIIQPAADKRCVALEEEESCC